MKYFEQMAEHSQECALLDPDYDMPSAHYDAWWYTLEDIRYEEMLCEGVCQNG